MSSFKDVLDSGDLNKVGPALRGTKLGSVLTGLVTGDGSVRTVRETVAVATAAATPSKTVLQLLYAKTIGTGAAAVKAAKINGATPGTGEAAPNAGGTSIVFNAETTGTGTVDLVYLTADAKALPTGAAALTAESGMTV